jgi:hypothetical protein
VNGPETEARTAHVAGPVRAALNLRWSCRPRAAADQLGPEAIHYVNRRYSQSLLFAAEISHEANRERYARSCKWSEYAELEQNPLRIA